MLSLHAYIRSMKTNASSLHRSVPIEKDHHCEPRPLQGPSVFEMRGAPAGSQGASKETGSSSSKIFKNGELIASASAPTLCITFRARDRSDMLEWITAMDTAVTDWD